MTSSASVSPFCVIVLPGAHQVLTIAALRSGLSQLTKSPPPGLIGFPSENAPLGAICETFRSFMYMSSE